MRARKPKAPTVGRSRRTDWSVRPDSGRGWLHTSACLALCVLLGGCASVVSSVTEDLAEDLSSAILDSEDLAVVRDGAPADPGTYTQIRAPQP
ncbi:MAG: hypothetical protein F4X99_11665 [Gammaproteobacteria bacterium]|nr:hypothetical protein [Gammaproteobacteria bacterium]